MVGEYHPAAWSASALSRPTPFTSCTYRILELGRSYPEWKGPLMKQIPEYLLCTENTYLGREGWNKGGYMPGCVINDFFSSKNLPGSWGVRGIDIKIKSSALGNI